MLTGNDSLFCSSIMSTTQAGVASLVIAVYSNNNRNKCHRAGGRLNLAANHKYTGILLRHVHIAQRYSVVVERIVAIRKKVNRNHINITGILHHLRWSAGLPPSL